jgi:hypothetical protein
VELVIYLTTCLHGVHRDNILFSVPVRYFSDTPRSSYNNWGKIINFQCFILSLNFTDIIMIKSVKFSNNLYILRHVGHLFCSLWELPFPT